MIIRDDTRALVQIEILSSLIHVQNTEPPSAPRPSPPQCVCVCEIISQSVSVLSSYTQHA